MADVRMDIPAVLEMSGRFDEVASTLTNVNNVMEVCMTILKTTAFVGMVGGVAVERYLEALQPVVQQLTEESTEIAADLKAATEAFQRGDDEGATRFH